MSSSYESKRLSATIRLDAQRSGVQGLLGVVDSGPVMAARAQELRSQVAERDLSHLLPVLAEKRGGQSLKEEIRALEKVLEEADQAQRAKELVESITTPLLLMHTCFAFVTRMWEFAIVLLLAELTNNSLFIISFTQFLSSFAIFSLSPYTGKWLDKSNRLAAMKTILFWKVLTITAAYVVCMALIDCQTDTVADTGGESALWKGLCNISYIVYAVPVTAAGAHLAFSTAKMSLEKDWVVSLARGNKDWLSGVNSKMTQIDLACQSLAPCLTGVLYYMMSYYAVACMLLVINLSASLCLYVLLTKLYEKCPALAVKAHTTSHEAKTETMTEAQNSKTKNLLTSGCAGTLISFSCLYLTVLSFGSIMIVYLRWTGLPDYYIGLARGLSSLAGFSGALVYPHARKKFGLYRTGIYAIWFQVLFVFLAAAGIYSCPKLSGSVIMIIAVLFSRAGLWLFDLCARQISQETIEEASRGVINGQWQSLRSFFTFSSFGLACLFSDPSQFWILTSVSFAMVLAAAVIFSASYASSEVTNCGVIKEEYEVIPDLECESVSE